MSHSRPEEGLDREVVVVSPVKMADQAGPQEQEQILVLGQGHPGHPEQDPPPVIDWVPGRGWTGYQEWPKGGRMLLGGPLGWE